MRFALRLPDSRLERVRFGLTRMGIVLCLLVSLQAIHTKVGTGAALLSLVATLANVTLIGFVAHRAGDTPILLVPVSAVLAVVTGIGIDDPISAVGICVGLVVGQTMYGSRRSVALRVLLLLPVVPLSVALSASPLSGDEAWHSTTTLAAIPTVPVLGLLIFVLRGGLESQAATIASEGFSARLSARLLAADTVAEVVEAMVVANDELARLSPGLLTLELVRIGPDSPDRPDSPGGTGPVGGARLSNWHGELGGRPPEIIPPEALAELPPVGQEGFLPLAKGSALLTGLGLPDRKWHAAALQTQPDAPVDLVLYGVRASLGQKLFGLLTPEEIEFLDSLTVMRTHWRTAMARVEARSTLIATAEQDGVTGLPDRSTTIRQIVRLLQGDHDGAGLIILHLDGLDAVEEAGGVAAADAAAIQLAHRITNLVPDGCHVGRGSDETFVVTLPPAAPPHDLEALVGQLQSALTEPVLLPAGAIRLGVRTGSARTAEADTAADLLDRAGADLYAGHAT